MNWRTCSRGINGNQYNITQSAQLLETPQAIVLYYPQKHCINEPHEPPVGGVAQWLGLGLWLADFPWYAPDLWLTCDHFVGKASAMGQPTRPTQPPTLSGTGMSSISVDRWMKLLAAVSPSSECLYEGQADVVYL